MIGQNIKRLRLENHMTQKELADRLFVTAQAVSRWENSDVEPSLKTVAELAKIFGVSTDEILGVAEEKEAFFSAEAEFEKKQEEKTEEQDTSSEEKYYEAPPQILALCEKCNNPIYNVSDIVRYQEERTGVRSIRCKSCDQKIKKAAAERAKRELEETNQKKRKKARSALVKNIVLGVFFILLAIYYLASRGFEEFGLFFLGEIMLFSFFGCIFFRNSFFGHMLYSIFSWHDFSEADFGILNLFILIFDLIVLGISAVVAFFVGLWVAPFLYPFAIVWNIRQPEKTMLTGFWD